MSTCKTCRFWGPENAWGWERGIQRVCHNEKLGESPNVSEQQADALMYQYSEGGAISTGPDFGCVHHECVCAGPMDLSEIKVEIVGDGHPHGECEHREQQ